ncbi:hypothetical protein R3P38DRAFT_2756340 [Favolaschia claudopus]|uniref:Uncharacterized protein n=1 Tax=Favolaschia claudopus TaxID=2862362 RepID=A0AAW0EH87_9AGAR
MTMHGHARPVPFFAPRELAPVSSPSPRFEENQRGESESEGKTNLEGTSVLADPTVVIICLRPASGPHFKAACPSATSTHAPLSIPAQKVPTTPLLHGYSYGERDSAFCAQHANVMIIRTPTPRHRRPRSPVFILPTEASKHGQLATTLGSCLWPPSNTLTRHASGWCVGNGVPGSFTASSSVATTSCFVNP